MIFTASMNAGLRDVRQSLNTLRKRAGLSIRQLAERSGFSACIAVQLFDETLNPRKRPEY